MKAMILTFVATLFAATIATYPPAIAPEPAPLTPTPIVTPAPIVSQATTASVEASWTIPADLNEWLLGGMVTP